MIEQHDMSIPPSVPDSWRVLAKSVIGASHVRTGKPNQDCIGIAAPNKRTRLIRDTSNPPIILAVSDGHGSSKAFRSHFGSLLAVVAARKVITDFLEGEWFGTESLSLVKRTIEERLPKQITQTWRELVLRHHRKSPFDASELSTVGTGQATTESSSDHQILTAYGATLLTFLLTKEFMLFLQLGDGDILAVEESGIVSRPIARDERLIANETFSLSNPNAWQEFKTCFRVRSASEPTLVLLATDGYANSFRDESSFIKVGPDFLAIMQEQGFEYIEHNIEEWLHSASRDGSGDDISVGIVVSEKMIRGQNSQPSRANEVSSDAVSVTEQSDISRNERSDGTDAGGMPNG